MLIPFSAFPRFHSFIFRPRFIPDFSYEFISYEIFHMRRLWHETWKGGLHLQLVSSPLTFRRDSVSFRLIFQRLFHVKPSIPMSTHNGIIPMGNDIMLFHSRYKVSSSKARTKTTRPEHPGQSQMLVFHWFYKVLEMSLLSGCSERITCVETLEQFYACAPLMFQAQDAMASPGVASWPAISCMIWIGNWSQRKRMILPCWHFHSFIQHGKR